MRGLAGSLAFLLPMAAVAAPGLRLEGGPFLPYRINQAVAVDDDGLLGTLVLQGLRWDGTRIPLFRTRLAARSRSADLAFYLDEEIRRLELRIEGDAGNPAASFELAAPGTIGEEEAALRTRMRRLEPPVHLAQEEKAPPRFILPGSDLVTAGFQASSALFGLATSPAPLLLLGVFVAATWIAAAIPPTTSGRRVFARGVTAGAAIVATFAVVYLTIPKPTLFRVAFPGEEVPGVVERKTEERPGYTQVTYRGAGAGLIELVGLSTPAGTGIPVTAAVPLDARVRFSSVPLVTLLEGERVLVATDFATGWVVHAKR